MSEKLKSCPFCGGEAFVNFDELGHTNLAHVMCSECWASGPECDDGTEQVAWNTRATTPTEAARVLLEYLSTQCDVMPYENAVELPAPKFKEWEAWLYASGHLRAIADGGDDE